jgi:hypothetical protein
MHESVIHGCIPGQLTSYDRGMKMTMEVKTARLENPLVELCIVKVTNDEGNGDGSLGTKELALTIWKFSLEF